MSSSSGKGGSSQTSLNYYGTLAGALCWGPLDWIDAVIANGNYVFQGHLTLSADVTDLTGSILDPELIAPGGYLKIYRGTETQNPDTAFPGHPAYRGTAWLAAKHIFFGQNSGTAPNLQVIGGRKPRVSTAIVAAIDNIVDDGQINPIAAMAEILLDERGGGKTVAQLDAASWLASAHLCAQDQTSRDLTFCSPLITQQTALRDLARRLLDPFNGFCRWTKQGTLACMIYEWGIDPGGLPLLDARQWTQLPKMTLGDWDNVPTEVLVNFTNRDYEHQKDFVLVPNAHAQQVRQLDDQRPLDRVDVMRKNQAHRQGVEYNRRIGTAPSKGTLKVRAPFVFNLLPGDKIKLDTDPEPGGGGLAQIARVQRIEQNGTDEATVQLMTDNLLPAVPYSPAWTAAAPEDAVSPPLVHFLAVPLPPLAFGLPLAVGILATRPSAAIVGMEVHFSQSVSDPFDELGQQIGFAVRATLAGGISDSATTLSLTETDSLAAPDAALAANTPGGNTTAAANNTLLALIVELDGDGRIAQDAEGDPIMEFVSIVDRAPVGGATFSYTVMRARLDTEGQGWSSGAVVWIFPRANLAVWNHELLGQMAGDLAMFRLVSYTSRAVDDTIPVPECGVNMLPATAPMYLRALAAAGEHFVFVFKRSATLPATPTGTTPAGWSDGPPVGTDFLWMSRAVKRDDTGAIVVNWSTPVRLDGDDGLDGVNGLNNAVVFIYQRAASAPTLPSASTTYTFATASLTGLNNGWSSTIPAGSNPLYVSAATASAAGATDTIAAGEWAGAVILAQDGTSGGGGGNSASVFIYKRSATSPSLPSASTTYTFATAALTGLNNGWAQTIPGGSDPLWVSTATAFSTGSTDSITAGEWAAAQILALDGSDGESIEVEWSVDGATSWHYPFVSGDKYFRQRIGSGAWSGAVKAVGEDGADGADGDPGDIPDGAITSAMLEDGAVSTISVAYSSSTVNTSHSGGGADTLQEIGITTVGEALDIKAACSWVPLDNFTFTFKVLLDGVNIYEATVKSPQIGPCHIVVAFAATPDAGYHNVAFEVNYSGAFYQVTPFTKRFLEAIALKK